MRNYVRPGTPMRRGMGGPSYCNVNFVGPLSPQQQATCLSQVSTGRVLMAGDPYVADQAVLTEDQLANIKDFYYQAGQDNAPGLFTNMPNWVVPAGIGLLLLSFVKGLR